MMTLPADTAANHELEKVIAQPSRFALFFDVDGTLIELAPTPESVVVPSDLPLAIARASNRYGGAVALLSGRSIAWLDQRFEGKVGAIGGLHGLERRGRTGLIEALVPPPYLEVARLMIDEFARQDEAILVEDKGLAIAVHYRAAQDRREAIETLLADIAIQSEGALEAIGGKALVELRTAGADKGSALEAFMHESPFNGRIPVFFGDDRTDEDGFRAVRQLGGIAVAVGRPAEEVGAMVSLSEPASVRAFLMRAAGVDEGVA
ncbi:trehalose-phosphatase [Pseudochelatococcus sp. G4_1912]|uniref:trehalose-phosphatase n=1 Tax=Pseudochelatococcus sp. G4_1912 TaxID=3114288 RepID=UPI0039C7561A